MYLCIYTMYLCISTVYLGDIFHFPNSLNSLFISSPLLSADSNLHLLSFTAQTSRFYKLVLQLTQRLDI